MIADLTVGKFLPNFGSYLQGKCQESRPAADKLTNGLFNGGCRKTSVEEKLHNFLTQSHTRFRQHLGMADIYFGAQAQPLFLWGLINVPQRLCQAQIRLPGFRGESKNFSAFCIC